MTASIVQDRVFYVIACIPKGWTDTQVVEFVSRELPRENGFVWDVQGDVPRIRCNRHDDHEHVKVLA